MAIKGGTSEKWQNTHRASYQNTQQINSATDNQELDSFLELINLENDLRLSYPVFHAVCWATALLCSLFTAFTEQDKSAQEEIDRSVPSDRRRRKHRFGDWQVKRREDISELAKFG